MKDLEANQYFHKAGFVSFVFHLIPRLLRFYTVNITGIGQSNARGFAFMQ
jgi:hypothetical protein